MQAHATSPAPDDVVRPADMMPRRPELLVALCDAELFAAAGLAKFADPVFIEDRAGEIFVTSSDHGVARLIDGMPVRGGAPLAGALSLSAPSAEMFGRLILDKIFLGGFGGLTCLEIKASDRAEDAGPALAAWLIGRLHGELDGGARQLARLHLELAELRASYAELSEQFLALETFVSEYASVPLLAFTNGVDGTSRTGNLGNVTPGDFLQQTLPVRSTGLAAFELFIPPADSDQDAPRDLTVELITAEDGALIATWRVEAAGSRPGWMGFTLSRGIPGSAKTPVLRISDPDGASAPDLGLGKPNPVERACVLVNATAPMAASLALKIWAGLPGVRVPMLPQSMLPLGDAAARPILISAACLAAAEQISATPPGLNFPLVSLMEDCGELQLHPLDAYTVLVRLGAVLPVAPGFAFAQLRRGHAEAPEMEVAAGCAGSAEEMMALLAQDISADGFSGWTRLSGPASLRVCFSLRRTALAPRDVYVAVRLAPGFTASYAWARLMQLGFTAAELP